MKNGAIVLRLIHSLFAAYFIGCIVYIYYCALTLRLDVFLGIAIVSLAIEGILVFALNNGHCPLAHLQRKLGDPVPFFNLFLPDKFAKLAIPFFSMLMLGGIALLAIRLALR